MEIKIIRNGNLVAFVGKVENLSQLKNIFSAIKSKDRELGYEYSYQIPQLTALIKRELLEKENYRIRKVFAQYGYNSLADVVFYAQVQNDEEAKALLNWYSNSEGNGYDDLIWDWIDNELPKYKTVEELLSLDLKQIETQIFEKTKDLLPKEED